MIRYFPNQTTHNFDLFVQIDERIDGIDFQIRSSEPGSRKMRIVASHENGFMEDGSHYQLQRPQDFFMYEGDLTSENIEEEILQQFYDLPNYTEIYNFFKGRFAHLLNNQ